MTIGTASSQETYCHITAVQYNSFLSVVFPCMEGSTQEVKIFLIKCLMTHCHTCDLHTSAFLPVSISSIHYQKPISFMSWTSFHGVDDDFTNTVFAASITPRNDLLFFHMPHDIFLVNGGEKHSLSG
jgi:hypothetical protein